VRQEVRVNIGKLGSVSLSPPKWGEGRGEGISPHIQGRQFPMSRMIPIELSLTFCRTLNGGARFELRVKHSKHGSVSLAPPERGEGRGEGISPRIHRRVVSHLETKLTLTLNRTLNGGVRQGRSQFLGFQFSSLKG
jgi:hypothetical protein